MNNCGTFEFRQQLGVKPMAFKLKEKCCKMQTK